MKHFLLFISFTFYIASAYTQPQWQQKVNTIIGVTLDDKSNFLYGYEEFTYTNSSPDTLRYIFIHLWANGYLNDHTPFAKQKDAFGDTKFYYSKTSDRGYIDSLQFVVDGKNADYNSSANTPDIARLDLPYPLLPGKEIKISTPFRVKIPIVFSRLGHSGQAYFISQWFPKPAVYDTKGWHLLPYLDYGEFFSEYGSYDVTITLPKNYIVMATGNCTNKEENEWLDSLAATPLPSDTLYSRSYPASSNTMKSLHFHEDRVHDFAWFADKRWIVRKDTVTSPGNQQLVTAYAAFLPAHQEKWLKATNYLKTTVAHYGKWVGPYEYKTIKAVEGDMLAGGGMEYPTVTIIDRSALSMLQTTVVHEAGHNWFYGMLGTNERDHAWMDEGINTFYEQKTDQAIKKDSIPSFQKKATDLNDLLYYEAVAIHNDQAIDQTAINFTKLNYGADVYYKTALMLRWLESYMGEKAFEDGMHEYYATWRYHHPYPEDLQAILQKHTNKNIDWFFSGALHTDKKVDFKVTDVHTHGQQVDISVKNNSGIVAPVKLEIHGKDKTTYCWVPPFNGRAEMDSVGVDDTWSSVKIADEIPDAKTDNNVYRRNALFHTFKLALRPIFGSNRINADKLFYSPAFGYNHYDGFMVGILLHDLTIPENRFRFAIAPMYGTGSNSFAFAGSVGYFWYPGNLFKEILLQIDAKSFKYAQADLNLNKPIYAGYTKVAPFLEFTFNEHNLLSPVRRTLTLKTYNITEDVFAYSSDSIPSLHQQQKSYGLVRYKHDNTRAYNPFDYSIETQMGEDFAKINAEANIRIDYFKKDKALYARFYAGKFIAINNDPAIVQRYYLNSTFIAANDYLYDGTYYGRTQTSGVDAQQISMQEGGLKIPTQNNIGRSDNYMLALNLKSDLPINLPIRLFVDVCNYADPSSPNGNSKILYDGGIEFHLSKDALLVTIPLIMSDNFINYLDNTFGASNAFGRSITFSMKLSSNWLRFTEEVLKDAEK